MSEIDPLDHYRANEAMYDAIEASVTATREAFLDADRPTQRMMLQKAVAFALISAQTRVENHERAYTGFVTTDTLVEDELAETFRDAGVNYCNNKASYVLYNLREADADRVIDLIEAGTNEDGDVVDDDALNRALRATIEEFKGVAMIKSAYALAKLGVPKMACIDTNVAQVADIDADDVYDGVVPEKYFDQWDTIEEQYSDLRDAVDGRFIFQWVLFDTQRETVTQHEAWFTSLSPDAVETPSIEA